LKGKRSFLSSALRTGKERGKRGKNGRAANKISQGGRRKEKEKKEAAYTAARLHFPGNRIEQVAVVPLFCLRKTGKRATKVEKEESTPVTPHVLGRTGLKKTGGGNDVLLFLERKEGEKEGKKSS